MGESMTERDRNELAKIHSAIGEILQRDYQQRRTADHQAHTQAYERETPSTSPDPLSLRVYALERQVAALAERVANMSQPKPLQWPEGWVPVVTYSSTTAPGRQVTYSSGTTGARGSSRE